MRYTLPLLALIILAMTSLVSALPSHETVRQYQIFLQRQGYDPGPVNGIVSSKTMAAIQQYVTQAETGDRTAQYHVGTLYAQGLGVPRDFAEAVRWYRRAAERGLNEAQYMLGMSYASGDGVSRNLIQAYAWYYVAVQGSNRQAKKHLSRIEERMTARQRQQALELGKKLFKLCSTSMAQ